MKITPGIHPSCDFSLFSAKELEIIECFKKDWYITNSGEEISLGLNSRYLFILVKPPENIANLINIEREIVVLFSPYRNFEPRSLEAVEVAQSKFQKLRIERVCTIIVSADDKIQASVRDLLKNDEEAPIVIPFSYSEFPVFSNDAYFMRNRLTAFFFSRDLFAAESPLRTDLFFFGRTDVVQGLISRNKAHQVSAIFGLRKSGKTSLIYGLKRGLLNVGSYAVVIDCQNPALNHKRWYSALRYIVSEAIGQMKLRFRIPETFLFDQENASDSFEKCIRSILSELRVSSLMLIFDEIESITFNVAAVSHWKDGLDFLFFWQTLRALFQKDGSPITYVIFGTNPLALETQVIQGVDNPIYAQMPTEFIPRFDVAQTREMVRKLGRIMGLNFQEHLYGSLTEDYGGHPYLIRHACSLIHRSCTVSRPVEVTTKTYDLARAKFLEQYAHFYEMILGVLRQYYPDEFDLLRLLALGDEFEFEKRSAAFPNVINHLVGYGLIERGSDGCYFRNVSLRDYIAGKDRYLRTLLKDEEMWNEISERRNVLEIKLRKLIKNNLLVFYGKEKAAELVKQIQSDKSQQSKLDYRDLFDPKLNRIYFWDLVKILRKEWDLFSELLGRDKDQVIVYLEKINALRSDAHAKPVSVDEFAMFRLAITDMENRLKDFE